MSSQSYVNNIGLTSCIVRMKQEGQSLIHDNDQDKVTYINYR